MGQTLFVSTKRPPTLRFLTRDVSSVRPHLQRTHTPSGVSTRLCCLCEASTCLLIMRSFLVRVSPSSGHIALPSCTVIRNQAAARRGATVRLRRGHHRTTFYKLCSEQSRETHRSRCQVKPVGTSVLGPQPRVPFRRFAHPCRRQKAPGTTRIPRALQSNEILSPSAFPVRFLPCRILISQNWVVAAPEQFHTCLRAMLIR